MTAEAVLRGVGDHSLRGIAPLKCLETPPASVFETLLISLHHGNHLAITLAECLVVVLDICKPVNYEDRAIIELARLKSLECCRIRIHVLYADFAFRRMTLQPNG
jgi:hypothetical protein